MSGLHNQLDPSRFERLEDLTAIDETARRERPENDATVVYTLTSLSAPGMVRLTCALPRRDASIATATTVWPSASWYEREAAEMFGLTFTGHPDPRRILLPEEFDGHPLRKDFPLRGVDFDKPFPVCLEEAKGDRADG